MPEPFIGELKMFAFDWAPRDWALCQGQLLPIMQNQSLYTILGTTYGGDGRTTFGLPDLRGRSPMAVNATYPAGHAGGQEGVVLTSDNVPPHTHEFAVGAPTAATQVSGNAALLAQPTASVGSIYAAAGATANTTLRQDAITPQGGDGHDNMMPSLVVQWGICLRGLFPPRN